MIRYINKVFRLKHGETVKFNQFKDEITFSNGEEFHIVNDVVYMKGHVLPSGLQGPIYNWILNNKHKFVDDTRIF